MSPSTLSKETRIDGKKNRDTTTNHNTTICFCQVSPAVVVHILAGRFQPSLHFRGNKMAAASFSQTFSVAATVSHHPQGAEGAGSGAKLNVALKLQSREICLTDGTIF